MFRFILKKLFPWASQQGLTTVHYAFPLVLFATIFASLASVVSEGDSYITLRANSESVVETNSFYVDVGVFAHQPVNAVDLTITYPEDLVFVEAVDVGTSVITLWTETPYAKDGKIHIRGGTFRKGFIGEHPVARIKVRGDKSGVARLVLDDSQLIAGDGKGTEIPAIAADGLSEVRVAILAVDGSVAGAEKTPILTDTNRDGKVDITDLSVFMSAWFTRGSTYDFDDDGEMTLTDFSILLAETFSR